MGPSLTALTEKTRHSIRYPRFRMGMRGSKCVCCSWVFSFHALIILHSIHVAVHLPLHTSFSFEKIYCVQAMNQMWVLALQQKVLSLSYSIAISASEIVH